MFGNTLKVEGNGLSLILRQPRKDELSKIAEGISDWEVKKFLGGIGALTENMEEEWYDKASRDENSLVWSIQPTDSDLSIGNTALHGFRGLNNCCSTGCVIWDKKMWRNGIASLAHIARTWFAAKQLGVFTIHSEVYSPNIGSWKALEKVGYIRTGTTPRCKFVDGKYVDKYSYTWINPNAISILFPEGLPEQYEDALLKASNTLELGDQYVKYV